MATYPFGSVLNLENRDLFSLVQVCFIRPIVLLMKGVRSEPSEPTDSKVPTHTVFQKAHLPTGRLLTPREQIMGTTNVHLAKGARQCPEGFMTRGMLQDRLGLTMSDIKKLKAVGLLEPVKIMERTGWALYDDSTVDKLRGNSFFHKVDKRMPGFGSMSVAYHASESQQVFALLRQERTLIDIQIETGLHPTVVAAIVRDYTELSNAILIDRGMLEEIEKLPLEGTFPIRTARGLVTILRNAAKEHRCVRCQRKRSRFCGACAKEMRKTDPGGRRESSRGKFLAPET